MKRIFLLIAAGLAALWVAARPAKPVTAIVTQADGTSLAVTLRGDEHQHYYTTRDGLPLMRGTDQSLYHAETDAVGRLRPSCMLAHETALRGAEEKAYLARRGDVMERVVPAVRRGLRPTTRAGANVPVWPVVGQKRVPVILVEFADVKFSRTDVLDLYQRLLNGDGAPEYGIPGSVHQYFWDQSCGQFDMELDVTGPYTLSHERAYYGANDQTGNDLRPCQMVSEAVCLADDQLDYSLYDWNNDGEVDNVYVVYAGRGEADSYETESIWPHEYYISGEAPSVRLDGMVVDHYACSNELRGRADVDLPDGIGGFCHEFSHCLGLPDAYHTAGGSVYGMNYWSLMDAGEYLGPAGCGEVPCGYTAFERWCCGWIVPDELTAPCTVADMAPVGEAGQACVIVNNACAGEYYLLENRQQTGWDTWLPGHGLLVMHVDYDAVAWAKNVLNNNPNHPRYTIIAADGTTGISAADVAGDPYPGTSGNTALTDTSTPAATLFHANADGYKLMGRPIENIAESVDGRISFTFCGGGDGIGDVQAGDMGEKGPWFDLSGRMTDQPARGIFVRADQKILKR